MISAEKRGVDRLTEGGKAMSEEAVMWMGESGTQYKYLVAAIDAKLKKAAANYIFARQVASDRWIPLYIGETDSLGERIPNHEKLPCVRQHGATHLHAHMNPEGEEVRKTEEADLIRRWGPICNRA